MRINKTIFKEITRCKTYYGLQEIYRKKKRALLNNINEEKRQELLNLMFDSKTYEDKIDKETDLYMKEYYDSVEKEGIKVLNSLLNINMQYREVGKQKRLGFKDSLENIFETYADGYFENDKNIFLLEVKSCSSKTIVGKQSRFINVDGIFQLSKEKDEKTQNDIAKLYDKFNDAGKYIYDATFTYYLSTKNNPKSKDTKMYLAVLNDEYKLDIKKVTRIDSYPKDDYGNFVINVFDISKVVQENLRTLIAEIEDLTNLITNNEYDEPVLGKYCSYGKQDGCMFIPVCYKRFEVKGSILEYYRHKRYEDMNKGKILLSDISENDLKSEKNKIQRSCFINNERYINKEKIKAGLDLIKYPIYYLDFETFQSPLPRFDGEWPNSQSLFQFSLHIEKEEGKCDIDKDHYSFLANDYKDYRKDLCEELTKLIDLSNGGTVLVYNQTFEKSRIKELQEFFPKFNQELKTIDEHIFDLMDLLVGNKKLFSDLGYEDDMFNFYDNALKGSFSIKKVLPMFSNLSYQGLDVKNGLEAQEAYSKFRYMEQEDIEEERNKLIEYCKLDTWSMVVILEGLKELIK